MPLTAYEPEWKPVRSIKRERRAHPQDGGPVIEMARADGYVMARRPRCIPFVVTEREWRTWPTTTKTK